MLVIDADPVVLDDDAIVVLRKDAVRLPGGVGHGRDSHVFYGTVGAAGDADRAFLDQWKVQAVDDGAGHRAVGHDAMIREALDLPLARPAIQGDIGAPADINRIQPAAAIKDHRAVVIRVRADRNDDWAAGSAGCTDPELRTKICLTGRPAGNVQGISRPNTTRAPDDIRE